MALPKKLSAVAFVTALAWNPAFAEDSIDSAFRLCAFFDNSDLTTDECKVSGWDESVNVTMNVNLGEAKTICKMLAASAKKNRILFTKDWKLKIYSPFSGKKTIAFCSLG